MLPFVLLLAQALPPVEGESVTLLSMRYIDTKVGDGEVAAPARQFTVHYTGWLRDGTKFDSSVERNEPFVFVQGRRMVIAGWETGFEGMRAGGKRRLFIPYQLAYGELGRGPIPPKAELIFDVELLKVSDPPTTPAAIDVLMPFGDIEAKVMALARAVPEEKLDWRPSPGVRSFGEVFLHIAFGNKLLLKVAAGAKPEEIQQQIENNVQAEKQPATKERIVALLTESFAEARKNMEAAEARTLTREVEFFSRKLPLRGIFVFLDTHAAEHLGQAIAYARANGITPPWSTQPSPARQ